MSDEEDTRSGRKRNPLVDDEADEEDDEEEEEAADRRRKRPRNRYIDEEAVVDDDDEDLDEEDDDLMQEDGFIAEDAVDNDAEDRLAGRENRRLDQLRRIEEDRSAEEVAAELNERYRRPTRPTESDFAEVPQRMLMPSVEDPNVWSVRCKIGREKNIVMTIMLKAFACLKAGTPLSIISAFVRDSIPGRLFVEARKFEHVLDGLRDITGVYTSQPTSIFLVPIEEMADLLKIKKVERELTEGGWVRIKRGRNAGDLAQVIDWTENKEEVGVRFVPRIDLTPREEETFIDSAGRKRKKNPAGGSSAPLAFRPPQRFFNFEEVAKAYRSRPPQPKGPHRYTFNGDDYVHGYCEKDVRMTALTLEGVNPTLDEISKFMGEVNIDGVEADRVDLALLAEATKKDNDVLFQPGDHIEVFEGEQAGARGTVNSILNKALLIDLEGEGLEGQRIEVPTSSVRKRFKPGDHIKVISGKHADETGLVVKVEDQTTTFLSDLSLAEVSVFSKDIREAAEVGSGVNVIGGYELHDLVQLDQSTAGVIFKIEREMFHVLDQSGQIVQLRPHQILKKRDSKNGIALDANGKEIRSGETVIEIDGDKREGVILHVYQGTDVFLYNRDLSENGGVFLARARKLTPRHMTDISTTDSTKMNPIRQGGEANKMAPPSIANFQGRGRDPLKGKHVSIIQGMYKTYRGIVKETLGTTARIELQTIPKTITVELEKMVEIDPKTGARLRKLVGEGSNGFTLNSSRAGSVTPSVGSGRTSSYAASLELNNGPQVGMSQAPGMSMGRTPAHMAYGAATPAYGGMGGRTPAYAGAGGRSAYGNDGRTPAYFGGRTPAYAGASGARTPAWGGGGTTPFGGGKTPVYTSGAKTPAYGAYGSGATPNPYAKPASAPQMVAKDMPIAGVAARIGGEAGAIESVDEARQTCNIILDQSGEKRENVPFSQVRLKRPGNNSLALITFGKLRGQRCTVKSTNAQNGVAVVLLSNNTMEHINLQHLATVT